MESTPRIRVLAACKNCNAQYDVSGQKPSDVLHCRCGGLVVVPEPRAQDARLMRCASCGASRGSSGEFCEFCGARFSMVDKGWGTICPGCFCRLPNDAQFCVECGIKLNPQKFVVSNTSMPCPRCKITLQSRSVNKAALFECVGCAGVWLPVDVFEKICSDGETASVAARLAGSGSRKHFELTEVEQVKYIPCPSCTNLMNRRNFGRVSGVIIDTCKSCGVWLDSQELNRIVQFLRDGGMDRMRDLEKREREHTERMKIDLPMQNRRNIADWKMYGPAQPHIDLAPAIRFVAEIVKAIFL